MSENVILVGVKRASQTNEEFDYSMEELAMLSKTAGTCVAKTIKQSLSNINPATYIGKGKVEELKLLIDSENIKTVIFNDQLSPIQERNLSNITNIRIIDRTTLILDIFAAHAHSKEGKIQVEVAQYEYLLPRLIGKGLILSRLGGGIGTRGPGETKLEVDRRSINRRLKSLKGQLKKIELQRETQSKKRANTLKISLVGYTNSGKTTLLNALTKSDSKVADKLFSTLDSRTRRLYIEGFSKNTITISDTVGFIDKLPTSIIDAFKSTLKEVVEADLVLHIVNSLSPNFERQIEVVENILSELKVEGHISTVFNKIDLITQEQLNDICQRYPNAIYISALHNLGLSKLKRNIKDYF